MPRRRDLSDRLADLSAEVGEAIARSPRDLLFDPIITDTSVEPALRSQSNEDEPTINVPIQDHREAVEQATERSEESVAAVVETQGSPAETAATPAPTTIDRTEGDGTAVGEHGPESSEATPSVLRPATVQAEEEFVLVGTALPAETELALHVAAWERGGPTEKSPIVREVLTAFLADLDALAESDPEAYAERLATIRADPRAAEARTPRMYRVPTMIRDRLADLAKRHRIPMAATVRTALIEHFRG